MKTNGKLEIFFPFLNYNPDPKDFFRPTQNLEKLLTAENFSIETNLIGVAFLLVFKIFIEFKLPDKTFFFIFLNI